MSSQDPLIKWTQPIRVAEAVGTAPGWGTDNISPIFTQLLPEVLAHLKAVGARPGISIAHYEEPVDGGRVVLHVGFDLGAQDVVGSERVHVVELPAVEVASVIHRGTMEGVAGAFNALMGWAEDRGHKMDGRSRELYLEWHDEDPTCHVTELQLLVAHQPS
jgi:effector-binding domain-containing protein